MPPSSAALKRCKSRAPKIEFPEPIQRDLGSPVVPRKIFRFAVTPNHQHHPRCPTPQSGGSRTSRTRGGMRGRGGGATSRATPGLTAKSCGPDAATLASSFRGVTVKAIAQGMPVDGRLPVVTTRMLSTFAHEAMGASRTRHSLRPASQEGRAYGTARAYRACEKAKPCLDGGFRIVILKLPGVLRQRRPPGGAGDGIVKTTQW
jgi:hypothetical protein